MTLLSQLATGPTAFRGEGVNHENEPFVGTLSVLPLEEGRAVLLRYAATIAAGDVVHTESTLLGVGPDGALCLWPVMPELPEVLPHPQRNAESQPGHFIRVVFGSGPRDDLARFREEITLQLHEDGSLVYAHAWGLPGEPFADRSSCTLRPTSG